jgi:hypothetical protein
MEITVFMFYAQCAGINPLCSTDESNVTLLSFVSSYFPAVKKGKAIPLQALAGPEGSRRLRLPDFKTIGA